MTVFHRNLSRAVVAAICVIPLLAGCSANGEATLQPGPHDRQAIKYLVLEEARRMNVPAALALAVAHAESNFNAHAESHKGARGVMQIMPATARGEYGMEPGELWNPRLNIRLGLHFLGRLLRQYRGRQDLALSYYNGGSAVGTWPNARVIPATWRYVAKVRRLQSWYREKLRQGRV
ncbi:MAG: lytic transglycosylase domain-containing protein [Rhodospirillales bacterium]|nr:lytic transglycosylase domain-containing protein [Rhodospirillales bacterium]